MFKQFSKYIFQNIIAIYTEILNFSYIFVCIKIKKYLKILASIHSNKSHLHRSYITKRWRSVPLRSFHLGVHMTDVSKHCPRPGATSYGPEIVFNPAHPVNFVFYRENIRINKIIRCNSIAWSRDEMFIMATRGTSGVV